MQDPVGPTPRRLAALPIQRIEYLVVTIHGGLVDHAALWEDPAPLQRQPEAVAACMASGKVQVNDGHLRCSVHKQPACGMQMTSRQLRVCAAVGCSRLDAAQG